MDYNETTPNDPFSFRVTYDNVSFKVYEIKPNEPINFKKNDLVKFKVGKKVRAGKIMKMSKSGVDVNSQGEFFFCRDFDVNTKIFKTATKTKNYR